jgi:RNA polymerase sigma-70 factor (ECF subfamily)
MSTTRGGTGGPRCLHFTWTAHAISQNRDVARLRGVTRVDRADGLDPRMRRPARPARPIPFARLLEQCAPALLRFCVARVGPERGEDVFQETMLAALRAYGTVRDPGSVCSWPFSIAARKAIDSHRDLARTPEPVADLDLESAHQDAYFVDEAVWVHVRRLPDKQREAVTLCFLGDLSHREIARITQTSAAAARRNVFEALRRLRADLEPSTPQGGTA